MAFLSDILILAILDKSYSSDFEKPEDISQNLLALLHNMVYFSYGLKL